MAVLGPITDQDPTDDAIFADAGALSPVGITALAVDPDVGDIVSYDVDDSRFSIDGFGVITVTAGAVFDAVGEPSVDLLVTAMSSDGSSSMETFRVAVIDPQFGWSDPIRLEVENFDTQPSTFRVDNLSGGFASNDQALAVAFRSQGGPKEGDPVTTSTTYTGPSGLVNVVLGTFDEFDGDSEVVVRIGGVEVANFLLDQSPGGGAPSAANAVEIQLASNLILVTGDLIEITVSRFGEEYVRLDYIDIIPIPPTTGPISPVTDTDLTVNQITEDAAAGTAVGITALAVDPDAGETVTYLVNDDRFDIDATGVVTVAADAVFDTLTEPTIQLTVTASSTDGSVSNEIFAVSVVTPPPPAPQIDDGAVSLDENTVSGIQVGQLATQPFYPDSTLAYSITAGNEAGYFDIDTITGLVTVASNADLDFETERNYQLTIEVAEQPSGGLPVITDDGFLTIDLNDLNEAPIVNDQTITLGPGIPAGSTIGHIIADDPDGGDIVTYGITGGDPTGIFDIDATSGRLSLARPDLIGSTETFSLSIQASDAGTPSLTDTATVQIDISDLVGTTGLIVSVPSTSFEAASGAPVATISRTGDVSRAQIVNYTIQGDVDASDVAGNPAGSISFAPGQVQQAIPISPFADGLVEGVENLVITVTSSQQPTQTFQGFDWSTLFLGASPNALPRKYPLPDLAANALVIDLSQTGQTNFVFPDDQDVIFLGGDAADMPHRVRSEGGRDIVFLGGTFVASSTTSSTFRFDQLNGSVFIDGVHIDNAAEFGQDAIVVGGADGKTPDVTIQNTLVENISGIAAGRHGDVFQPQGPIGDLKVYNLTGTSSYQGFFIPEQPGGSGAELKSVSLENVNLRHVPGEHNVSVLLWLGDTYPTTLKNVYVTQKDGQNAEDASVYPFSSLPEGAVRNGDKISWPSLSVTGEVEVGSPPFGDFVQGDDVGGVYVPDLVGQIDPITAAQATIAIQDVGPGNDSVVGTDGADAIDGFAGDDTIEGLGGNDILHGSLGLDSLDGGDGNDTIRGGTENDTLLGGDGNDILVGDSGDDRLEPGAGDAGFQILYGGAGNDVYVYAKESNKVYISSLAEDGSSGTADRVVFTDLNRSDISFSELDYSQFPYEGDQIALRFLWSDGSASGELSIAHEAQFIEFFEFADGEVVDRATLTTTTGTSGNDTLVGTGTGDTINGLEGQDSISGLAGADSIDGGLDEDTLDGGAGNDTLLGGDGNDILVGQSGDDRLEPGAGEPGFQILYGGGGNDTYVYAKQSSLVYISAFAEDATSGAADRVVFADLSRSDITFSQIDYSQFPYEGDQIALRILWDDGTASGELRIAYEALNIEFFEFADGEVVDRATLTTINGTIGNDTLVGSGAGETINGLDGEDSLIGSAGSDSIDGGSGNDTINGEGGDDTLVGGAGNDILVGESGDDRLDPGAGDTGFQILYGGSGNDVYVYAKQSTSVYISFIAEDASSGTADRVVFTDLNRSDITFAEFDYSQLPYEGDQVALRLLWNDGTGSGELRIADHALNIEFFEFADGEVVDRPTLTTIGLPNNDPVAAPSDVIGDEDTAIDGQLSATDIDNDVLTYGLAAGGDPLNGTVDINPVDGGFTYTPNADFNGPDSFTYEVSDGNGGTDTAVVNLTVDPVNDDPVADPLTLAGDENTVIGGQLSATDVDGDSLTYGLATGGDPANGVVDIDPLDGSFSYTPNLDYTGADSFTYEVSDGNGGVNSALVTITVDPTAASSTASDDDFFLI